MTRWAEASAWAPPLAALLLLGGAVTCSGGSLVPRDPAGGSASSPGSRLGPAGRVEPDLGVTASVLVPPAPGGSAPGPTGTAMTAHFAPGPEDPVPARARLPPCASVDCRTARASLPRFHEALQAAASGRRTTPLRVLWFGDSHTAADFWTGAVRRRLQALAGNGGPGYVALGLEQARHDAVLLSTRGTFRREPPRPAAFERQGDGVYGLLGQRSVPTSGDARVEARLNPGAVPGVARWEVLFRAPAARFTVTADRTVEVDGTRGKPGPGGSPIRRVSLETRSSTLLLSSFRGAVELFGAIVESTEPGLVLDAVGINGARASTPLGWDETVFLAEVAARAPALLVIAYGTNDIPGQLTRAAQERHLVTLLDRLRRASPDADCLLIGPTDLAQADGTSHPRAAEVDALVLGVARDQGCAGFSAYQAMGGEGSISRWARETPPLAQRDGVHLTALGYQRLGEALLERGLGVPP